MQMFAEIKLTKQSKKNLNGYRFFPGYTISQNPTYRSFGKVNIIIFKEGETGPKWVVNVRDYS